jgi:hypothetical protein
LDIWAFVGCSGKSYLTTPRHLDDARDAATLDAERLLSYEYGSAPDFLSSGGGSGSGGAGGASSGSGGGSGGAGIPSDPLQLVPSVEALRGVERALVEIQDLMLVYHERLEALERGGG